MGEPFWRTPKESCKGLFRTLYSLALSTTRHTPFRPNNGARELPRTCTSQGLLRQRAKLRCSPRKSGIRVAVPFHRSLFHHNSASLMASTSPSILAHITWGRQDHLREFRAREYRHGAEQRQGAGGGAAQKRRTGIQVLRARRGGSLICQ